MSRLYSARHISVVLLMWVMSHVGIAAEPMFGDEDQQMVMRGLREFYAKTARADGSFQPGVDPEYLGLSDSAHSDLAPVTYACTIHKTFGWTLPHEEQTAEFLLSRQKMTGEFVNVAGTVDPASPQARTYNTTQALVALRSLGRKPRYNPLPVFEEILKQDYKTLPAYSTSFFPLAYLCAGQPIPEQADRSIRSLMVQDDDGFLNNHIAATFHASHYYSLIGETTPKWEPMIARTLREQKADGSWFRNSPSRDRHATFDAVFTLLHEGRGREDCRQAIERAAAWALSCRNEDGGFGHFPGSTSDADAIYFQVGTLVMAGFLKPVDPLPVDPQLLSWGHLIPLRKPKEGDPLRIAMPGWAGGVALSADGKLLATGSSDGVAGLWDAGSGQRLQALQGHSDCVVAVALAPDGKSLLTGSHDSTARIWDAKSGQTRLTLAAHRGAVLSVAWAPDGSLVATAGIDGTVRLWDSKTGACRHTLLGHKSWVNSVAFSPEGEWLVSGSSDGTLKVWSTAAGKLLRTLEASKAEVRSVAVSPNGQHVAAGIRYGTAMVWETREWRVQHTWTQPADDVWAVAFSADNKRLFTAAGEWNRSSTVVGHDVASGNIVGEFKHPGEVLGLAVSADGRKIAAAGADKTVSVWPMP